CGIKVIYGQYCNIIEFLHVKPKDQRLTIYQNWHLDNQGHEIMLLRSKHGASDEAKWAFENIIFVENYTVLNYNLNALKNNYCSKWILQAFYYGANIKLTPFLTRLVLPQA